MSTQDAKGRFFVALVIVMSTGLAWTGVTIVGADGRGHPRCPPAHGGPARVGGATEVHDVFGDVGRGALQSGV